MIPTFDSGVINRRFKVEWTQQVPNGVHKPRRIIRIYKEAMYKDGRFRWQKIWTTGEAERKRGPGWAVYRALDINELFGTLELDATEVAPPLKIEGPNQSHGLIASLSIA